MTTHTKGPWRVRESALYKEGSAEINPNLPRRTCTHCGKPAVYADGTPAYEPINISIEAKGFGVAQIGTLDPVNEFQQHMANALVIAAAPDMIEQLKQDYFELTTLSPRLQPQFRKSVDVVRENIRKVLDKAGERP